MPSRRGGAGGVPSRRGRGGARGGRGGGGTRGGRGGGTPGRNNRGNTIAKRNSNVGGNTQSAQLAKKRLLQAKKTLQMAIRVCFYQKLPSNEMSLELSPSNEFTFSGSN